MIKKIESILFLCTGNACRSQMAEGWGRALLGAETKVYSAGIETHGLNPLAVQVMAEVGIDISRHSSKRIADLPVQQFDLVVTVCGHAHEHCPLFSGKATVVHQGFDDPPYLAQSETEPDKILAVYRRVRDEIGAYVRSLMLQDPDRHYRF